MTDHSSHAGSQPPRQARDVVGFGHETGRALSDGTVVGRAEPFAKVFPSSRAVKQAVGLAAWGVLEDIALDAAVDEAGRLVAATNVRRIAGNLGLGKDTVAAHLRRLREYGFVLCEEPRQAGSGRWQGCRYVLDPAASVPRLPHTLATTVGHADEVEPDVRPCPQNPDTAEPVSGSSGHGQSGQDSRDVDVDVDVDLHDVQNPQHQHPDRDDELRRRLGELGVVEAVADDLLTRHRPDRVGEVADAAEAKNPASPAGWVVAALRDGWDVAEAAAERRGQQARQRRRDDRVAAEARAARVQQVRRDRVAGWAAAVSAALDDTQLVRALEAVTAAPAGLGRLPVPLARAQLLRWAITAHQHTPAKPLAEALAGQLAAGPTPADDGGGGEGDLPPPPHTSASPPELSARLAGLLGDPPGG